MIASIANTAARKMRLAPRFRGIVAPRFAGDRRFSSVLQTHGFNLSNSWTRSGVRFRMYIMSTNAPPSCFASL